MNENEDDYWDCPSCGRPTPPEHDRECHCGKRASHHLSVFTMCKILDRMAHEKNSLIVENEKLKKQLEKLKQ